MAKRGILELKSKNPEFLDVENKKLVSEFKISKSKKGNKYLIFSPIKKDLFFNKKYKIRQIDKKGYLEFYNDREVDTKKEVDDFLKFN